MEGLAGIIYKELREKSGLKATQLYSGILSRNTYYRFENGLGEISIENYLQLVDRLNIDMRIIENKYEAAKWKSYTKGAPFDPEKIPETWDDDSLATLLHEQKLLEQRGQAEGNIYFAHLARCLILKIRARNFPKGPESAALALLPRNEEIITALYDFLLAQENWYRQELIVHALLLPYFSTTQLCTTLSLIRKRYIFTVVSYPNTDIVIGYQYLRGLKKFLQAGELAAFNQILPFLLAYQCPEGEILTKLAQVILAPYALYGKKELTKEECQQQMNQALQTAAALGLAFTHFDLLADIVALLAEY